MLIHSSGIAAGNVAAYRINFPAGGNVGLETFEVPTLPKDNFGTVFPRLTDRSGKDFRHELVRIRIHSNHRADGGKGITRHIVRMFVAATGHDKTFAAVVDNFSLAFVNKGKTPFLSPA